MTITLKTFPYSYNYHTNHVKKIALTFVNVWKNCDIPLNLFSWRATSPLPITCNNRFHVNSHPSIHIRQFTPASIHTRNFTPTPPWFLELELWKFTQRFLNIWTKIKQKRIFEFYLKKFFFVFLRQNFEENWLLSSKKCFEAKIKKSASVWF